MKEQINYVAMCCDRPMMNMGLWPRKGHVADVSAADEAGVVTMNIGTEQDVYCNTYHCLSCNRYIGIAWHQKSGEEK